MAKKDPAVLWYWNDWQGGTATFTRHLKGCYMDLLNAQFNSGKMSLTEIKTILGPDFGSSWPTLQKKFIADENGMFYNPRMEEEKERRKAFTESRKKNLANKKNSHMDTHMGNHMADHMDTHMENENVNENLIGNGIKNSRQKKFSPGPGAEIQYPFGNQFLILWEQWKAYKLAEFKFRYKSPQSEQASLNELVKLAGGMESVAGEIIAQSMAKGWKGFFELKNSQNGHHQNKPPTGADISTSSLARRIMGMPDPT